MSSCVSIVSSLLLPTLPQVLITGLLLESLTQYTVQADTVVPAMTWLLSPTFVSSTDAAADC